MVVYNKRLNERKGIVMDFKEMATHMTEQEIKIILKIVYPYANLVRFTREKVANFITVYFEDSATSKLQQVDFLPDDIYIYDCEDSAPLDGEPLGNCETLYKYKQFMVAYGYSEVWLSNPFVCQ